jgi:hypothetical protein
VKRTLKQQLLEARKTIRELKIQDAYSATRIVDLRNNARLNAEAINVLAKTNMRLQAALELQRAGFQIEIPVSEKPAVGEVVESFDQ